jgi:hypothetical protein
MGLGFELKASHSAKQVLYSLSHASSPFFAMVILEMGFLKLFAVVDLKP